MLGDADPGRDGSSSAQSRTFERIRISALTVPCEWAINFYRKNLSPLFPPCCRFTPTCSAYALEAYRRHGLWRGSMLTIWRILRCNPFCRGGFDPVPPARSNFNQTAK